MISQVMALRRPIIHKVLDYEDEFFAFLMLVLETHSMRTTGIASTSYIFASYLICNLVPCVMRLKIALDCS